MNTPIPPYKRPSFPDLASLRHSTQQMSAQLDRHAARENLTIRRPVHARELAGVIKAGIERRTGRYAPEIMAAARREILDLVDQLEAEVDAANARGDATPFHTSAGMAFSAVREFMHASDDEAPTTTRDNALRSTRELAADAIASIERFTGRR